MIIQTVANRDRERERERERQTDRQTDRKTETERHKLLFLLVNFNSQK